MCKITEDNQEVELQRFIDHFINELNLRDMNPDEAECVVYAWCLKSKIGAMSLGGFDFSKHGKSVILSEIKGVNDWAKELRGRKNDCYR